jgi:hypothetical protein
VVPTGTKGGAAFPSPEGRLYGFFHTGAPYFQRAPTTTLAPKARQT